MRILLVTQLFQPEPAHLKGLEFAKELIRLGHDVEVLTGFPNYPGGKIYPGYKMRWKQREDVEGVAVTRVAMYPSHNKSGLKRAISYGSLAFAMRAWGVSNKPLPDVIYVYQGAATLAWPAIHCRKKFGIPYVLDVQDLWPESVTSSGMLKIWCGEYLIDHWCRYSYKHASSLVVLSEGYKKLLIERGVDEKKINVVQNWASERSRDNASRITGISDDYGLAGRFNVVFAGNMGELQSLSSVIEAACKLEIIRPNVRFVFVGDGTDKVRLEQLASDQKITNCLFLPRKSSKQMKSIYDFADTVLIHLRDDPLTRVGIPQKTQAYMAAGRPIIAAASGETASLVTKAKAGIVCQPERPEALIDAVIKMSDLAEEERCIFGRNGASYYKENLAFRMGVKKIESLIKKVSSQ